ncbi:MAG: hypothetical protein K2H14_07880 [Muribaculaceae bacterium]|nr:hypothetical protein [Muribaculaceae bacterium]
MSGDAVALTNDMTEAQWAADSKLVFNTTNNLAVGYIYAQIIDRNPINPDEAIVRTLESHARRTLPENRGTYWQDDEVPFLALSRELVFEEGHVYDLKVVLYDFETPPYSRTELATYNLVINGSTPGYQYADARLVSITPDPDTYVINSLADAHFTMTFDNWVKVNVSKSGIPGAFGMTYLSESDVTYSDDHNAFTITIPESEVVSANGSIAISVYVTDEEGHAVYTGSDTKENSYFAVAYSCYLGSPDLEILPATGVVEEIKDIYISCPNGPAGGMINVLSAAMTGHIKITDLSGDVVFAEFTSEPVMTASSSNNDGEFPTQWKFSLDEAITAPGVYVVNIPPAYFALGAEFDSASSKAQFVTYTIEGEPADETRYDFIPYIDDTEFEKNDNGEITKAKLTVWFEESMVPDYNKTSLLELKDADNNKLDATFMLDADWNDWQILYVTITYPFVEGEAYTLVMPAGIVGNDAWAEGNYLTGRANPACVLNVHVEEEMPPVEFDLELTTSVELKEKDGNIVQAVVTFDSGDYLAWDDDMLEEVELVDALGNTVDATVEPGMSLGGDVKLIVAYAFEPNQKYQLLIPEGLFGDEIWEEEMFMTGHANAEMTVEIDTTISGVENVIAGDEVKVDVYNLQGVMIVKDADAEAIRNLPAGLYIIGGQKVAVK